MNYDEAIQYIHSICWRGSRPGLERIGELCNLLGNPQDKLKFVHVAGTNGKGSVCAMLTGILHQSGLRVGTFTSPYIYSFRERMCVDGEMISCEDLAYATQTVKEYAESMDDPPTEFELISAVAFAYFLRSKCDIVVLEAGLGGRLDSTNIISRSEVSVITGVALDHTEILGDTTEKIAHEKAGIIKSMCPVVAGRADYSALKVIEDTANEKNSPFIKVDYNKICEKNFTLDGCRFSFNGLSDVEIPLVGAYQPENAAIAITAARAIGISDSVIRKGLSEVKWPGRFEVLSKDPTVIYDGGHNTDGVKAIKKTLDSLKIKNIVLLTAVMADKKYEEMAAILSPYIKHVYCVSPKNNERALPASDYADVYKRLGCDSYACDSVQSGLDTALEVVRSANNPLLVCGSLYLYKEFRDCYDKIIK